MLDKLISIRETLRPSGTDVFAVLNTTMDTVQAVDLLLYVFDYDRADAVAALLVAETKRRRALEVEQPERIKSARRKVAKAL
jgi:hypothetical protein